MKRNVTKLFYICVRKLQKMGKEESSNWYALYTSPRAEKKVLERLQALGNDDIVCYLPLHRTPRVWSDRVKIVEVPLFNSYLFVKCPEHLLRGFTGIYGVVRVVYYNGRPAIIRPGEIEAIREFLRIAENQPLCIGEEVEILTGAMKHVPGIIRKIKKNYLVLYLERLGATVSVKINDVDRVKRIK